MHRTSNVVIIASEMVPYCKTGGLADVIGALPGQLAEQGAEVTVFIPYYRQVVEWAEKNDIEPKIVVDNLTFFLPGYTGAACVREYKDQHGVRVLFIDYPSAYDRESLYTESGEDYPDNLMRFSVFSKAALEACKTLNIKPDILHAHDWQASMALVYLKTHYASDPFFANTGSVLTVHNLGYQGRFPGSQFPALDLPWDYFNPEALEYFGQVNALKGGIIFADRVTTVSPTYAKEIQTTEQGAGLDGVLKTVAGKLSGILNGVDYSDWDPRHDPHIVKRYWVKDLGDKEKCKAALLEGFNLPPSKGPLIGMVTRLAEQKGIDLALECLPAMTALGCQVIILGTGDPTYEEAVKKAVVEHPKHVAALVGFSNPLAHKIEAGCDMFLMPSRYEPCGLNQMYSLRYGTIPIVSPTGGLLDTVVNYTPAKLRKGEAGGFVMKDISAKSLTDTIKKAVKLYIDSPSDWKQLTVSAMEMDFGWPKQAKKYMQLFDKLLESREAADKEPAEVNG